MGRLRRLTLTTLLIAILFTVTFPGTALTQNAEVLAPHWIIYDVTNDRTLAGQRMDQPVPMASLTKVMTALLTVEQLSLNDEITIVKEDQVGEASIWAEEDDVFTVQTLLYGLLMRSGNDAASALARAIGGSPNEESESARATFTSMMNARALQLGMTSTRFSNPHGLDSEAHYSTAHDLMLLTREAMKHPVLVDALGAELWSGEGFHFGHTNRFPEMYDGVIGGKTGWTTNAGLCLIEVAERGGRTLIVVLLGSSAERWYLDAADLFDYGWKLPDVPRANLERGPTQW